MDTVGLILIVCGVILAVLGIVGTVILALRARDLRRSAEATQQEFARVERNRRSRTDLTKAPDVARPAAAGSVPRHSLRDDRRVVDTPDPVAVQPYTGWPYTAPPVNDPAPAAERVDTPAPDSAPAPTWGGYSGGGYSDHGSGGGSHSGGYSGGGYDGGGFSGGGDSGGGGGSF